MKLNWKILKGRKLARKTKFQGLDVSIETDKGQNRYWYDPHNEEEGHTKMKYPYGYIVGLKEKGEDGECLDVYIGPNEDVDKVYIVHQRKAPDFKKYDEDKVMLGFESKKDAKQAYLMHYNDDRFLGEVTTMSVDEFKNQNVKKAIEEDTDMPQEQDQDPPQEPPQEGDQENPFDEGDEDPFNNGGSGEEKPLNQEVIPKIDPYDINNIQSVSSLLNSIGKMKDKDLSKLATRVWGEGYQYRPISPTYVTSELRGFLQDQLELLEDFPQLLVEQQLPNAKEMPHSDEEMNTLGPESSQQFEKEPDQAEELNNG